MKNKLTILSFIISILIFSQSNEKLDSLFNNLTKIENSHNIIISSDFNKISNFKSIPFLINMVTDTNKTNVFSDCKSRYLTKGELSLIIIDRIEKFLPYFTITKMQNCIMIFCENNPNLIEYYFNENIDYYNYQTELVKWFKSDDRINFKKMFKNYNKKELKSQQRYFQEQL